MSLQAVDVDGQTPLGRGVGELDELLDGAGPDQGPVGLEKRPQWEDPDVIEAEGRDRVQVGADRVEVEIEPVMEPAAGRGVVDAEAGCGHGDVILAVSSFRGRAL